MKKLFYLKGGKPYSLKVSLKMKLTVLFTIVSLFQIQANTYSQSKKITLDMPNATVAEVIQEIETLSDFKFLLNRKDVDLTREVSIKVEKQKIAAVLSELFVGTDVVYEVLKKQIILRSNLEKITHGKVSKTSLLDHTLIQFQVTGIIRDGGGAPLPGANILEKGTTNGTQTGFDGNFSISLADENAILVVSYIGFKTQEVAVSGRSEVNMTMQEDAAGLDEVVVVGYGSQKKSDLTGAVTSLNPDDMNPGANASVDQLMQGRAAGVQINQASSEPGGGLAVRIRGSNSLNASNEPLYVIDGFPIDNSPNLSSGGVAQVSQNQSPRNPLNALNPGDIQSIEILKDASATAIYGSRGANGVILITTKKGKQGRMNITYDVYGGVQGVTEKLNVLSTSEYISAINDLSVAQGNDPVFSAADALRIGNGVDWQDEVFRSAPLTNHTLSVSGASERTSYYASMNYFDQQGVVKNSGIKRYTGRINLETKIGERTLIGLNFNTSLINDNNNVDGLNTNENGGPIYASLLYDPTEPILNPDGSFTQSSNLTVNNPVTLINGITSLNETNRTFGSAFINYDFTDALSGKFNFGTDRQTSRRDIYNNKNTIRGSAAGGIAAINTLERSNYLFEYTMTYNKEFNDNNVLTVLGGTTYQKFGTRFFAGDISGFPTDNLLTNNLGLGDTNNDNLNSSKEENTLLSYLGRINYNI